MPPPVAGAMRVSTTLSGTPALAETAFTPARMSPPTDWWAKITRLVAAAVTSFRVAGASMVLSISWGAVTGPSPHAASSNSCARSAVARTGARVFMAGNYRARKIQSKRCPDAGVREMRYRSGGTRNLQVMEQRRPWRGLVRLVVFCTGVVSFATLLAYGGRW